MQKTWPEEPVVEAVFKWFPQSTIPDWALRDGPRPDWSPPPPGAPPSIWSEPLSDWSAKALGVILPLPEETPEEIAALAFSEETHSADEATMAEPEAVTSQQTTAHPLPSVPTESHADLLSAIPTEPISHPLPKDHLMPPLSPEQATSNDMTTSPEKARDCEAYRSWYAKLYEALENYEVTQRLRVRL